MADNPSKSKYFWLMEVQEVSCTFWPPEGTIPEGAAEVKVR